MLRTHGFRIVGVGGVAATTWSARAVFMRGADGVVIVGPTKFGHELGLNVGRTLDGEPWIDMFLTTGLAWFNHAKFS